MRSIWLRHDLETFGKRLKALSAKIAQDGLILTEDQLRALEKAREEKQAHGEIETEHPGYLGCQDTYYVGNIKGVGRIYQQTFIDSYCKTVMVKLYDRKHAITAAAELTPTGLMSNGFRLQVLGKIKRFAWESTFDYVVISEEVGIMKPHRGIFDHARQLAGVAKPRHILYVGDHYESDILGASKAGWKTIWLNHYGVYKPDSAADVEVGSMTELAELFESYQRE